MTTVLIISQEPRLAQAIEEVLSTSGLECHHVQSWEAGQSLLFRKRFDLVCLDYEALKVEALDTFIAIDNIFTKEKTAGVLLVRQLSPRSKQLESQLPSLRLTVDMSQGRPIFEAKLTRLVQDVVADSKLRDQRELSVEMNNILSVEKQLPDVTHGRLTKTPLTRLLYAIRIRRETGVLRIQSGGKEVKIAFVEGELLESRGHATRSEVFAAFEWLGGEFSFERGKAGSGKRVDTLEVLVSGISRVPHQTIVDSLNTSMEMYPVPTNFFEDREEQFDDFVALFAVMRLCDGTSRLDEVLSGLGSMAHEGFKAVYFAVQTDVLHLHEAPELQGVIVAYDREIRKQREAAGQQEVQKTKAFRATHEGRDELVRELTLHLAKLRRTEPHDVFDVWEGCGRKVVQGRFYILVKEHHPDVYGGNVSDQVKVLAQDIFILFKETYQVLLKTEKKQTVPPPPKFRRAEEAASLAESSEVKYEARRSEPKANPRAIQRTPGPTKRAPTPEPEPEPKEDVKSRISQLSGFQRRKARAGRRTKTQTPAITPEEATSLEEEFSDVPEPEVVEVAPEPEDGRKAKLLELSKRASAVGGANAPNPGRDAFHEGYRFYREGTYHTAYEHVKKAYEIDPEDGLYLTFYGFLMYKNEPHRIEEAEEIVRKAMQTGNRAALPDAALFLGHILKAQGETKSALRQYERALRLNPGCTEAERELRLAKIRSKRNSSEPGTFMKNLFKK